MDLLGLKWARKFRLYNNVKRSINTENDKFEADERVSILCLYSCNFLILYSSIEIGLLSFKRSSKCRLYDILKRGINTKNDWYEADVLVSIHSTQLYFLIFFQYSSLCTLKGREEVECLSEHVSAYLSLPASTHHRAITENKIRWEKNGTLLHALNATERVNVGSGPVLYHFLPCA